MRRKTRTLYKNGKGMRHPKIQPTPKADPPASPIRTLTGIAPRTVLVVVRAFSPRTWVKKLDVPPLYAVSFSCYKGNARDPWSAPELKVNLTSPHIFDEAFGWTMPDLVPLVVKVALLVLAIQSIARLILDDFLKFARSVLHGFLELRDSWRGRSR